MKRLMFSVLMLAASPAWADSAASANATWRKLVEQQAELSLRQTPNEQPVKRFCEAALKTCTRVIFAKRNGKMTMLSEVEDVNEKLIARMVCKLNDSTDIRVCVDFDRGRSKTEMYDNGRWRIVEESK